MSMEQQSYDANSGIGTGGLLVVVGTAVTVVAAFLPWLVAPGGSSATGIDMIGDAVLPIFSPVLTVGLALIASVLALVAGQRPNARTAETVCGVFITLIALTFVFSPGTVFGGGFTGALAGALADPGLGIFATLGGGIAVTTGGLFGYYG